MTIEGGAPQEQVVEGVARTALLDLMRTVALLRVVMLHITGIDPLSLVASIPIIFFVAGALYAKSMERRRGLIVIKDRFRRILPSMFAYATMLMFLYASLGMLIGQWSSVTDAAGWITQLGIYDSARLFVPVLSLGAPVGPGDPEQNVYWTWVALWYVHTHLLLALIGPLLVKAYRRWFKGTLIVVGLIWLLDVLASAGTNNTYSFMLCFVAGFAFTDGRLLEVPRRTLKIAAGVMAAVGLVLLPFGSGLALNAWAPSLLAIGGAWIAVCLAYREFLEKVAVGPVFRPLIAFVNRRALTIYLWSLLGVYVSRELFPPEGSLLELAGVGIASIVVTCLVTLVACLAVGWIEDVAGKKRPELWPNRRPARTAG